MFHLVCQVSKSVSDQAFRRDSRSKATKETPLNIILKAREGVLTYPPPQPESSQGVECLGVQHVVRFQGSPVRPSGRKALVVIVTLRPTHGFLDDCQSHTQTCVKGQMIQQ